KRPSTQLDAFADGRDMTEQLLVAPPDAASNDEGEISRLAALSPVAYERERATAATKLGIRTAMLDKIVAAARRHQMACAEQGHPSTLASPGPWPEPVDGTVLLTDMTGAIQRYVVVESGAAETAALWLLHAHTLDAFAISPRLAITSPEK